MKIKSALACSAIALAFVSTAAASTCRGPKPDICNRTCWNARAPKCSITEMSSLTRAIVHHTASSGHYSTGGLADSKANVRGVQNYHMDANGWCDIGYHFLIDKHGNIFSGRKNSINGLPKGAHDGCNSNSMGFTAMGYFHSPYNNNPTTAMMRALKDVIAWKMPAGWSPHGSSSYCGGDVLKVDGHRSVKATACPGDLLWDKIKTGSGFRNDIAARRSCN